MPPLPDWKTYIVNSLLPETDSLPPETELIPLQPSKLTLLQAGKKAVKVERVGVVEDDGMGAPAGAEDDDEVCKNNGISVHCLLITSTLISPDHSNQSV